MISWEGSLKIIILIKRYAFAQRVFNHPRLGNILVCSEKGEMELGLFGGEKTFGPGGHNCNDGVWG